LRTTGNATVEPFCLRRYTGIPQRSSGFLMEKIVFVKMTKTIDNRCRMVYDSIVVGKTIIEKAAIPVHETLKAEQLHVAVDLLIMTVREGRLGILLSRRTQAPCRDCWALPGRLMALEESAEATAEMLLAEMLPIGNVYMEQLFTFSAVNRDPRGRVISVAYLVIVPWERLERRLAQPEMKLQCFTVCPGLETLRLSSSGAEVYGEQLAFDHGEMILTGVKRLRGKITYSELAFHFLHRPDAFSLPQLQTVFEAVLEETLDKSNFRRGILARYETTGRIRQTEDIQKQGRGRPAVLYQYNP